MLSCFALFTGHDLPSYHGLWNFGVLILVKTTINFGGKSWTYCIKNHIYLGAVPSLTNSTHHDLNTQSLTSVTLSCACTIKIPKKMVRERLRALPSHGGPTQMGDLALAVRQVSGCSIRVLTFLIKKGQFFWMLLIVLLCFWTLRGTMGWLHVLYGLPP